MMTPFFRSLPLGVAAMLCVSVGCGVRSPAPIRINEVLPSNQNNCPDEKGEFNDWVELYNNGDEVADVAGFSVTDDTASPDKSVLPEGLTIEPRATLLLWADGTPEQGKNHLSLKFKSKAERIVLYDPELKQVDIYAWTDAYSDVSFARVPDGTGEFVRCAAPSCGDVNGSACGN